MSAFGAINSASDIGQYSLGLLSTINGIDGKVAADTNLYTTITGKTTVVTKIVVRLAAVATLTTPPIVSAGQDATFQNVVPSTALTGLTGNRLYYVLSPSTGANPVGRIIGSTDTIKLRVITGAVAGTYTMDVYTFGYIY